VPRAQVHAVEGDPLAMPWTERNIARCAASAPHTSGRVTLHAGDFAIALCELDGSVDLVVSNPPYIPVDAFVPPESVNMSQRALCAGADGWTDQGRERTPDGCGGGGGLVAVEHGAPAEGGRVLGLRRGEQLARNPQSATSPGSTASSPRSGHRERTATAR
jgi:release factor glutamine methyltransferase